jgi:hypothetical protein
MPVVTSRVTFSESNDARPVYVFCGVAALLFIIDHELQLKLGHHFGLLYGSALLCGAIGTIYGIYCVMGCIWHPIPIEDRGDSGLTAIHLDRAPTADAPHDTSMFGSLDDQVNADDDSVDSSQVELRDPIQWAKMFIVLALLATNIALVMIWGR